MDPSDSHQGHLQVMDSRHMLAGSAPTTRMGLPGSSADLSACAVPYHPGRPDGCTCSLLPHRRRASPLSGGLATSNSVTRPKRVRLRYGSRVRLPGLRRRGCPRTPPSRLLAERAINKVTSFQVTRSARLGLAHQRHREHRGFISPCPPWLREMQFFTTQYPRYCSGRFVRRR